jgi:hypothetical protein
VVALQPRHLMNLTLHLQEPGGFEKHPFPLNPLQMQAKHIHAALHPPGDGALVALHLGSSPGAASLPEEKIQTSEILLRNHWSWI